MIQTLGFPGKHYCPQMAARSLAQARMVRFEERTGQRTDHATDLDRTANHFYIKYDTVEIFNERMHPAMNDAEFIALISMAQEFDQLKVRDDELDELVIIYTWNASLYPK